MENFIYIIINIILPIFTLIGIGFISQKKLKMDVRTFTRVNIYIFVPALLFTKVYETNVTLQLFGTIFIYLLGLCIIMFVLSEVIARLFNYPRGRRKAFVNSIIFFNSGNYGLPLTELAFYNNPLATTVQIFIMIIQTIAQNTVGVFQASAGNKDSLQALKNILRMPALYILLLVVFLKVFKIEIPASLIMPIKNITNGFVAVALITLGVQLSEVKIGFRFKEVFIASFMRLILTPVIGAVLIFFMGVEGILAKALILGATTPTAVNTAIIAKEFNNEPDYASQIVFLTTLLSSITVSIVILFLSSM